MMCSLLLNITLVPPCGHLTSLICRLQLSLLFFKNLTLDHCDRLDSASNTPLLRPAGHKKHHIAIQHRLLYRPFYHTDIDQRSTDLHYSTDSHHHHVFLLQSTTWVQRPLRSGRRKVLRVPSMSTHHRFHTFLLIILYQMYNFRKPASYKSVFSQPPNFRRPFAASLEAGRDATDIILLKRSAQEER
jgi:hypothetical protein